MWQKESKERINWLDWQAGRQAGGRCLSRKVLGKNVPSWVGER